MDTQTLKTFLLLAKLNNFTKTAEELFVAQSTVTNRIADLESELGKPLFDRSRRSISLSREGAIFKEYAERMLDIENAAFQSINSLEKYKRTIRIGTTNTIYECHLYPDIIRLMEDRSADSLKITIGHSHELLRGLQDGIMDMVYTYIPLYKKGFVCDVFAVDELILVTRSCNSGLSTGIRKSELGKQNYLFCNFALQEVGTFIRELFPPHYQFGFEIDNSTKLIPYLLDLGGISFLPESLAQPYINDGTLLRIPLLDFEAPKISCYLVKAAANA